MSKVHLVQLLCPSRHCVMAAAYEEGTAASFEGCCQAIEGAITGRGLIRRCALCKSVDLRFEDGVTRFNSLREAGPHLLAAQFQNLFTRVAIDAARQRQAETN